MKGAPSVNMRIRDLSEQVPESGVTSGALVIVSDRGPCNQRVLTTRKKRFRDLFGNEDGTHLGHYSALDFLERGPALYTVRPVPAAGGATYGGVRWSSTGSSAPVGLAAGLQDDGSGEPNITGFTFGANEVLLVTAANPGAWNSNLAVVISDVDPTEDTFYITVYEADADGNYVEVEAPWKVSRVSTKKDGYGNSLYVETVINGNSDYIWVEDNTALANTVDPDAYSTEVAFVGGANGTDPTHSNIAQAWEDYFRNKTAVSVKILISGGQTNTDGATDEICAKLISIANSRKDCFAALDVPYNKTTAQAITWRNALSLGSNPFFGGFYDNWAKIHCPKTDTDVFVPPSGPVAAVYAYCDDIASPWAAPMGTNRAMLNVLDVKRELSDGDCDLLYEAEINYLYRKPGKGIFIQGQRTAQTKRSSLSEVRSVRGLVDLMPGIQDFLEDFLGEPNNDFVRTRIQTGIAAVFKPLVRAGHLDSADVVCDVSNNTDAVRSASRLVVDGYIKITPTAEQIEFSAVVVSDTTVLVSF